MAGDEAIKLFNTMVVDDEYLDVKVLTVINSNKCNKCSYDPTGPATGQLPLAGGTWHQVVYRLHPSMATKTAKKKKVPSESARARVEHDSLVDNMVTNPGPEMTTRPKTSTTPEISSHPVL